MVHFGKHIIDPNTGLCEICDRGAIHEIKQGKRHGKQFLYSNQDGKFTYRPSDENDIRQNEERTPRHVRKPLYPEPPPARSRPVVHEQPLASQRKVARRADPSPLDSIQNRHDVHPATLYYIDSTGQMVHRQTVLPDEPQRRYLVQNHHSPPAPRQTHVVQRRAQTPPPPRPTHVVQRRAQAPPPRPTHVIQRRAQTPPPPASDTWRSQPRRKNNSDTRIIERQHRSEPDEFYHNQSPRRAELFHIQEPNSNNHNPTLRSSFTTSRLDNTPPPRVIHQGDTNRKHRQLEPIQRTHYTEVEPPVARRVYKKLSPNSLESRQEEYNPNDSHQRPARKIEKIYPPPRQYESSPQLTNRHDRSPLSNKNPSIYHIQSSNEY